jgi:hypothetical protein
VVAVQRQADLVQIVLATCPVRRLPRLLYGGNEQGDQHADNGDHDQQLNQRKP